MHPAYSIILFTTASGAGYGLLFLIGAGAVVGVLPAAPWFALTALALALLLATAGLLASAFHLGHPERAWRAISQWRSSWLSREGLAAFVTYLPAVLLAGAWLSPGAAEASMRVMGALAAAGAALTVFCTAKIYSTLPTVRAWHNGWVVPGYLVLALATGSTLFLALAQIFGVAGTAPAVLAAAALFAALAVKLAYWRSIARAPRTLTIEQATGLGSLGEVRQWEPPHTGENFVLREMGYRVARRHAGKLRRLAAASFAGAAALAVPAGFADGLLGIAFSLAAVNAAGLAVLIERWLFFAEAQHVATLYYGARAA